MLHAKTTYLKIHGSGRNQKWSKKIRDSAMIHKSFIVELYLTVAIAIERGQPTLLFPIINSFCVTMQDASSMFVEVKMEVKVEVWRRGLRCG